ncbi:OLC1v1032965C1 [Oldenlandia corymbosa var. corymbosa]|uniref:OLC1v1032965C1 n=1 Tax=Oldenlandia corymbosa var. corymbosa TaxID=529605 RepID=A0AAV1CN60_OLDCO|nr:OLC1v1032965C1 [Oldenlandia corymbosa var. corymbosa]
MAAITTAIPNHQPDPNSQISRQEEVKKFDESKIGVKGLVDRGVTSIPAFFVHPNPPDRSSHHSNPTPDFADSGPTPKIPLIDFSSPRSTIVDQVREAASKFGFFQIINHSVPPSSIKKILTAIKEFFELPESVKMEYYSREFTKGAVYSTNFDLYQSKAASWRDTLQMGLSPNMADPENVPPPCRETVPEWDKEVVKISEEVLDILFEGLGLEDGLNKLKEMTCLDGRVMAAHYYPYCPQPELTAGLTSHTDPGLLTVLVQNQVPGLQVKVGDKWVDLEPVEGGIIINIGDNLQIMSNDEYISVEHRVLANPLRESRVSAAVFLKPSRRDLLCGPFPELTSAEKPARFRQFTLADYMTRFFSKELDGKTLVNYYRA